MSRILVCGATGFIGANMMRHFAALGHEVHAVHFNRMPYYVENVIWHKADLRKDSYEVKCLMENADIVIQAAATTSGSRDIVNTPAIHVTDNAVMNSYLFRAAVEARVKHVIFFSCSTMFSQGHVTEESALDIHPKYFGVAQTKLYLERMCEFFSGIGETKFTAIRHSNIYGPHDKFDLERSHMFGATVAKVMRESWPENSQMTATEVLRRNGVVSVWGSGEESRDLLYISDLCDFVEVTIEKQSEKFGLYNCGYGVAFTVNDIVARIIEASGKKLLVKHDLSAPTIPTSLSLDCTKARAELGWNPKVTLPEGIRMTLEWYRQNAN